MRLGSDRFTVDGFKHHPVAGEHEPHGWVAEQGVACTVVRAAGSGAHGIFGLTENLTYGEHQSVFIASHNHLAHGAGEATVFRNQCGACGRNRRYHTAAGIERHHLGAALRRTVPAHERAGGAVEHRIFALIHIVDVGPRKDTLA